MLEPQYFPEHGQCPMPPAPPPFEPPSHTRDVGDEPSFIPLPYHQNPVQKYQSLINEHGTLRRDAIESITGFPVRDLRLYTEAFMHKSAVKFFDVKGPFERLEFMGDSVVGLMTTTYILQKYPFEQEGFLTRLKTKLVSGKMLSAHAKKIGLDRYILMDAKALEKKWNENTRILEDIFEALVGAIYLDLGLEYCKQFYLPFIHHLDFDELMVETNYKDVLMRYCQSNAYDLPIYELVDDTNRMFYIRVIVNGNAYGEGVSGTKKTAEQLAAKRSIDQLGVVAGDLKRKS